MSKTGPDFWRDKRVVVTGGDGYTGFHLCQALASAGSKVRALVRTGESKNLKGLKSPIEIITGDLLDYPSLLSALKGADVVFHTAAITLIPETRATVLNTFNVNAGGTLGILMAAKDNGVSRVVYTSTCHVYGRQEKLPIKEDQTPSPVDIYSASKLAGEHLCKSFVEMFGVDSVIARSFNHFGPRQREEFLIPTVIAKCLRGGEVELGNPKPTRDYSYASDIVRGYMLIAEKGRSGEVYHLASGQERSVESIANEIVRVGGFNVKLNWHPDARKTDLPRSVGDASKARKELGWDPQVSFEEGLRRTIEYYRGQTGS